MKRALSASMVIMALVGCGKATAVVPDGRNPAHCIAAFNYGAYWFRVGKRPEKVTAMVARGIFEMNKIKASGGSVANARAEGEALTKAYANEQEQMDALFVVCGSAQDDDAQFKAQLPSLLAAARQAQARQ